MDTFRLATYNIRSFPWISPPIREMVAWMTRHADVVALQEVWYRHSAVAAAFAARGWTFLRPPRESHIASIFGSGLAIAWRSDLWTLSDARFYPYLSAVGFDAIVSKGWFRVELVQRSTNKPLRLINTHMQSDYEICDELWRPIAEPVRMAQALQLVESEARMPPMPTLIVGDMNTEMCWLQGCQWLTQHVGPTFAGTGQVLDHCAARVGDGWILQEHRVGRECGEWSDHWPVYWRLALNAPTGSVGKQAADRSRRAAPKPTVGSRLVGRVVRPAVAPAPAPTRPAPATTAPAPIVASAAATVASASMATTSAATPTATAATTMATATSSPKSLIHRADHQQEDRNKRDYNKEGTTSTPLHYIMVTR
jgi:hypothetical protein